MLNRTGVYTLDGKRMSYAEKRCGARAKAEDKGGNRILLDNASFLIASHQDKVHFDPIEAYSVLYNAQRGSINA